MFKAAEENNIRIFISYRRSDSAGYAGRIADHLRYHLSEEDEIFIDTELQTGDRWNEVIAAKVKNSNFFLAVIGRHWLTITGDYGIRRLDHPEDIVRKEIELFLKGKNGIFMPITVGKSEIPVEGLPLSIAEIADYQSYEISDVNFATDIENLVTKIKKLSTLAKSKTQLKFTFPSIQIPQHWQQNVMFLGDLVNIVRPQGRKEELKAGDYPLYTMQGISDQVDKYNFEGTALLIPSVYNGGNLNVQRATGKFFVTNTLYIITQIRENSPSLFKSMGSDPELDLDYLYYFLSVIDISEHLRSHVSGTSGNMRITINVLRSLEIPVPPFGEQLHIVDRLEHELASIEKQIQIMEEYRIKVFTDAFSR